MALRWGIVSAGLIANDFTTVLSSLPSSEHQVVAVAARDLNRAEEFAQKFNIPKAYGSYEELAKDPNVEVAYIATQHPQHKPAVLLCLAAGKAVLCEKPMGVNAAEVREMVAKARSQGVFLMEMAGPLEACVSCFSRSQMPSFFTRSCCELVRHLHLSLLLEVPVMAIWSRFFPAMEALREVLVQGTIGDLRVARAEFGFDLSHIPRATDWNQAGGGLLDLGIYCVQFLSMIFGAQKPEKISAVGRIHETGVDDTVSVLLQYPGGVHGSFTCSISSNLPNTAYVSGTKGMAQIQKLWAPTELVVNGERKEFPPPVLGKDYNFVNGSCMLYEANHVRECLRKGLKESPVVPLAESELLAEILEEARKAIGVTFPQDKR
ncbi:trans-1,2-dihydrobenzene-1,2-diol dehydrogenase isoform X1 [Mus musculus]|uniref:trans-1,2-dihydrobenzene-1,2-diol dehydrogenase isoform X1 n=1 Tax=Mus musculus TaxID=10090 RepID=UPI0003D74300|nr:trans-1,2-dihydrobenzene-1,2-diol dehydrogenase isoform X1 [Mus musculus]|eukprot:XP_006541262.1 PREDICTED: trans-1,2-dihydrobenzene-1,2-diol dehydrogenase isoform X1 [Mus musculus]